MTLIMNTRGPQVCCPNVGGQQGQQGQQQNNNYRPPTPPPTQPGIAPTPAGSATPTERPVQVGLNHPKLRLLQMDLCGTSVNERIVNGKRADLSQFPWMARLGYITSEF